MKLKLNRKVISICSLVLILFLIGYIYNAFVNTKYKDYDTGFSEDILLDIEGFNEDFSEDKGSLSIIESQKEQDISKESSTFFTEYRLERDKNRSKEYDMWQNIIESEKAEETFKTLAQEEIVKIVSLTEKEMIIENLIIARGFKDALVFLTEDSVTVLVEANELNPANIAQIQDIVMRKTKLGANDIKIMKKD
ncbi:MAG: SpoIIIAH-like family protein [Firmicutes bacterium]|nr:SpoIIIAH-like family protein [Bacillota bacterium]